MSKKFHVIHFSLSTITIITKIPLTGKGVLFNELGYALVYYIYVLYLNLGTKNPSS